MRIFRGFCRDNDAHIDAFRALQLSCGMRGLTCVDQPLKSGLLKETKKVPRYILWVNMMSHEVFVSLFLCGDQNATYHQKKEQSH